MKQNADARGAKMVYDGASPHPPPHSRGQMNAWRQMRGGRLCRGICKHASTTYA